MGQLEFDEDVSRRIEAAYSSRDVLRRRELVRTGLSAQAGDGVLDVGCGPGFYLAELLEEVGPEGQVAGIDAAAAMLELARRRCEEHENVELREAAATSLPFDDASFDRALSVQVLEYVEDVAAALAEIHRVLVPGGTVAIWDVDWATLSMGSADPGRMERMLAAWDEHLTHRSLPRMLAGEFLGAGFADVRMDGHAFATAELSPDSYGGFLVPFLEQFVLDRDAVGADEAHAWADEQRARDARGEFYFSVTQFLFTARRPS